MLRRSALLTHPSIWLQWALCCLAKKTVTMLIGPVRSLSAALPDNTAGLSMSIRNDHSLLSHPVSDRLSGNFWHLCRGRVSQIDGDFFKAFQGQGG